MNPEKFLIFSVVYLTSTGWSIASADDIGNKTDYEIYFDRELVLTEGEKNALDKFKAAVFKNLSQEFMRQDLFLTRWLRAKEMDVDLSIKEMFKALEFYKVNRLDKIAHENFGAIEEEFPFYKTHDRMNRPVAYGGTHNGWDVRRGLMSGKRQQLMRYVYKIIFGMNDELIETQRKMRNVTTFNIIMNLESFNLFQHGCPLCIPTYINLIETYERFLPMHVHEIVIFNTPNAFKITLDMIRPVLSKHTRERLKIFGPNKKKWKPHLDALIDPKNLPRSFGGNLPD